MIGSPEACKAQLFLTMQEKPSLEYFTSHHFLISFPSIYQRLHVAFHQLPFIKPTTSFISKFYCISKFSVLHCTAIWYLILSLTRWVVQKISDRTPALQMN